MILLIDNYDSFSYNLVQLAGSINPEITVMRNDAISVADIGALRPSHIILSPGPGYPADAGICEEIVYHFAGIFPVLGVCLGHQAICEVYGAEICHAARLMHGKRSSISIDNTDPIFKGLPERIDAARYHSLAARKDTIPDELRVIARDDMGEVMAVRHRDHYTYGVQFHPESILTPPGYVIIKNFLSLGRNIK